MKLHAPNAWSKANGSIEPELGARQGDGAWRQDGDRVEVRHHHDGVVGDVVHQLVGHEVIEQRRADLATIRIGLCLAAEGIAQKLMPKADAENGRARVRVAAKLILDAQGSTAHGCRREQVTQ